MSTRPTAEPACPDPAPDIAVDAEEALLRAAAEQMLALAAKEPVGDHLRKLASDLAKALENRPQNANPPQGEDEGAA